MMLKVHEKRYRIVTKDNRIKFAGTGEDSWFTDLSVAKKKCNYSKGDSIYEYDYNGNKLWEVL